MLAISVPLILAGPLPAAVAGAGGNPQILSLSVVNINVRRATVEAVINPEASKTKVEFFISYNTCQAVGEEECFGETAERAAGKGRARPGKTPGPVTVSAKVSGLTPDCAYTYWVTATNESGYVQSAHQEFRTTGGRRNPLC